MNANQKPIRYRDSWLVRIGTLLFLLGSGPLLAVILAAALGLTRDPNPNPVGFGILAGFTFWPSVGLMLAGGLSVRSHKRAQGSL